MTSVLTNPTARLYAGALLGKSLTKELGELGASQSMDKESLRRATLTAGVASGKIKPGQLSAGDAALVGQAITKGAHIQDSGILGYLGGVAKEVGGVVSSFKGLPQMAYNALLAPEIEGIGHNVFGTAKPSENKGLLPLAKAVAQNTAHDFSSPQQILEHPVNPLLDVAGVLSGGAGVATKLAGATARAKAARFAEAGKVAGPPTGLQKKLIDLGSPLGRRPGVLSPGFGGDQMAADMKPNLFDRHFATQRPFMKYAIQKPLDYTVSKLQALPVVGTKLKDFEAGYYARKMQGRVHGQETAGASEGMQHPIYQGLAKALKRMYGPSQYAGRMQFEATILSKMGIDSTPILDEYINQIKKGEDVDGVVMTPAAQKMAAYRAGTLYQDEHFRELIEHPTDEMKEVSHYIDRMNVKHADELDRGLHTALTPQVIEDAMLGRLRELTGKTNEELIAGMKPSMRPQGAFAKGIHALQQHLLGEPTAEVAPSIHELAMNLPFGKMAQREDLIGRAVNSLKQDLEGVGSKYERQRQPGYLDGNNLFQKIAAALHDELGVAQEQAIAFARGLSLGTPEGPILRGYIPSVSGEKLKFGVRPDVLKVKAARAAGIGRFKALDEPPVLDYHDWNRPFSPRNLTARTIGRGPAQHYTEAASYGSFMKGVQDMRPEAIIENAYRINKDIVTSKLNPQILDRINLPNPGKADGMWTGPREGVEKLGAHAQLYEFVPAGTYRNYFTTQHELEITIADRMKEVFHEEGAQGQWEQEIEKLSEESAQKLVSETVEEAAHGKTEGYMLPKTYVKSVIEHARVSEQATGLAKWMSAPVQLWKTAVLSFSPAWLARTSLGHGIIALIDGTTNPVYWRKSHEYFLNDRPIPPEAQKALKRWNNAGDRILNPEPIPYGVNQGGMKQELADIQGREHHAGELLMPRMISKGVHVQNNFQRRAVFLRKLDVEAKQRMAELGIAFDHPGGFMDSRNIDAVLDPEFRATVLKYPDLAEHAFDQLAKVSYTFSQMTPWERKLVRYGMPFYGWFKFVNKFVWSMPMNYPGRTAAIAALGKVGVDEHEHELGPMPDYLSGALWFDHTDLAKAKYINLYGLNPMSDIGNPLSEAGPVAGVTSLGRLSPIIQTVLSGFGINPLTGEPLGVDPASGIERNRFGKLFDIHTGKEVTVASTNPLQRMIGSFLRTFPEVRNIELAITGGNPVYPESIPFVDEKPIGVNPQTRRGNTPLSILGQEAGVQPREIDLGKYQANRLKSVLEARKRNVKTVAKQRERLSAPNP